jgi:hypothetical protein
VAVNEQTPLPRTDAWFGVLRSAGSTLPLLARSGVRHADEHLGWTISFADRTSSVVFRETVLDRIATAPCALVVSFRLRWIRGRGHSLFLKECLLNNPLFVGFPGLVSKLWLAHDELDRYRGLYQWDGVDRAEQYARSLWRVLALVSTSGSIGYRVLPRVRLTDVLDNPDSLTGEGEEWWRPVGVSEAGRRSR